MNIPREHSMIFIVGLFLLGYLLDAVVDPLSLTLITPYHYFTPELLSLYPFTTASVIIKTIGLSLTPFWIYSFFAGGHLPKGGLLLVISSLLQLYALQDISTNAQVIPLEWSLAFATTGMIWIIPALIYFLRGILAMFNQSLSHTKMTEALKAAQEKRAD